MTATWPEFDVARDQPTFATLHLVSQKLGAAADPAATLAEFLLSTYEVAAGLGPRALDRAALERDPIAP
ncbi:MAG: hypothetical protein LH465_06670 [Sphingomonas bacterium]|nr:hypothetical protein [Sphingomonas bacterium]